jgi:hypothetical protein
MSNLLVITPNSFLFLGNYCRILKTVFILDNLTYDLCFLRQATFFPVIMELASMRIERCFDSSMWQRFVSNLEESRSIEFHCSGTKLFFHDECKFFLFLKHRPNLCFQNNLNMFSGDNKFVFIVIIIHSSKWNCTCF